MADEQIPVNRKALMEVLERLKEAWKRWCKEEVDDAEEMWSDIPEMLDEIVPKMEKALAGGSD
jgi:predicted RNase H-like HicB family nuclease